MLNDGGELDESHDGTAAGGHHRQIILFIVRKENEKKYKHFLFDYLVSMKWLNIETFPLHLYYRLHLHLSDYSWNVCTLQQY